MDWLKKWRNWSKIPISTRVPFFAVVILDITLFIPRFSKFIGKKTLIHLSLFQVFLIMPDSFYKAFIT